jgi:RNA polymerase sigma-70 factor, ECF subfamily
VAAPGYDDAADAWMRLYRAPLVGFVLPLVNGDLQAAEDVVQETMLRWWQRAEELNPERAGAWLRTVARNIRRGGPARRAGPPLCVPPVAAGHAG